MHNIDAEELLDIGIISAICGGVITMTIAGLYAFIAIGYYVHQILFEDSLTLDDINTTNDLNNSEVDNNIIIGVVNFKHLDI